VCTAKGHRWPELSALVSGLGLAGRVVFTDTVPTGTLASLLKASTMVIVPTLYEGGGSGPVADACLVGRPVLSSRIGPIEEQLEAYGGGYATFFDPESVLDVADAVERAMGELPVLERRAVVNRERLAERVQPLWGEWAEYYAGQFAEAAATRAVPAADAR
jgi:glycosyltransferase involved in cell wall biosynthesis